MPKTLLKLDTQRLLVAILFISVFAMAVRVQADTDMWWHLRAGQWAWEHRAIPRTDVFSHTIAGRPWIDHGWLPQLGMYGAYALLGYAGLSLGVAAIVTLAFVFVFLQGEVNPFLRAFVVVLAAVVSGPVWVARPQLMSFLLTAIFAYVLHVYKYRHRNLLWTLPLLMVLWVNCHGGFITGFILIGCYVLGEGLDNLLGHAEPPLLRPRRLTALVVVALVSLLATLVNPNTIQMPLYPFRTAGIGVLQDYIQEWASPNFHQLFLQPFIWMLLAILAAMGLSRRRAALTDLALVSVFVYMSLLWQRNTALFALVAAPILMRYAAAAIETLWQPLPPPRHTRPARPLLVLNWVLLAVVLAAGLIKIAQPLSPAVNAQIQREDYPTEAVAFVRDHALPGPMFNSYNWGGYLIWTLYPDYPVFVDGRTDLYDDDFLREYLKVAWARPGWPEVLDRYSVNFIFVESDSVLATVLAGNETWPQVYADEKAALFVRNQSQTSNVK